MRGTNPTLLANLECVELGLVPLLLLREVVILRVQ